MFIHLRSLISFLIVCLLIMCLRSMAEDRSAVSIGSQAMVDSNSLSVADGWVAAKEFPPFNQTAVLSKHSAKIWLSTYPNVDATFNAADSLRPVYFAQRFSEAWNLPLYTSDTSTKTQLFCTSKVLNGKLVYVLSAVSKNSEAKVVAQCPVADFQDTQQAIYLALTTVTVEHGSKKLFLNCPELSQLKRILKPPKRLKQVITLNVRGKHMNLPDGWFPEDLILPLAAGQPIVNSGPFRSIEIEHINKITKMSTSSLHVDWAMNNDIHFPDYRRSQMRARSGYLKRSVATKYINIDKKTKMTRYIVGVQPSKQTVRYIYISRTSAASAMGSTREPIEKLDKVVTNLFRQVNTDMSYVHSRDHSDW
jgi:hypothetical protein